MSLVSQTASDIFLGFQLAQLGEQKVAADHFSTILEADQIWLTCSRYTGNVVDEFTGGFNFGRIGFPFEVSCSFEKLMTGTRCLRMCVKS